MCNWRSDNLLEICMKETSSQYGNILIGRPDELFVKAVELLLIEASKRSMATIGLPGGTTPRNWFKWIIDEKALNGGALDRICWSTSDECYVPLENEESNFGNAARLFLDPMGVPETRRMPWPVNLDPYSASIVFNRRWNERFGQHRCFDLCFLGLGSDGRMASILPQSPVIGLATRDNFASVEIPELGWRLTITRQGLGRCGKIMLMVIGSQKAQALRNVMKSPFDSFRIPAHLLREVSENVTWLVDDEAAVGLEG
jgi:6-phosphogluconolactonase